MFAQKLRLLRISKKMPQLELAKRFNVAQQTVGKWENGLAYPNINTLKELAKFFSVSIDYLLDNDDTQKTPSYHLAMEETRLLDSYRTLSDEGKQLINGMVLQLSKLSALSNNIGVVQKNNNGNNYYGVTGGNFNSNVTVQ